ncbi:8-amino-7-oxononanoate synthase [Metabacillus iocasae]|uniref:8-amino-7-ketopelargonate synthase n=1 Tax=Priestia iocasae TaxID=2291674 RepID=A0ABS2QRN1_9BACI|nr:8-amino-7-oxononanoate synthase [Metabacillus iocasae]MBM7702118.1 8-amino-7-oxononanoate synthase [Metabacillus iocasae]
MDTRWMDHQLAEIKRKELYRTLRTMESAPKSTGILNGTEKLICASNNYLGLAADERLIEAATEAMRKYGVGSTGSRLITGNTAIHEQLERRLASFKQAEAAIIYSSGYLANIGVLSSLAQKGDIIFSDELNHASIIDGCRLSRAEKSIYSHVNLVDLESRLQQSAHFRRRFIVTDAVFSMDGNIAPLIEFKRLAKAYDAYLIVDDAHGTGVLGTNGRGTCDYLGVSPDVYIGTLSKGLGTEGGYVVGSQTLIDLLRNVSRSFIFQTAMSPAVAAATLRSIDILESEEGKERRHHLLHLSAHLRARLKEIGFHVMGDVTPIIPVLIGDADRTLVFAQRLQEENIFAPAIRPPTVPVGKSRIRICLTAQHSMEQVETIARVMNKVAQELIIFS